MSRRPTAGGARRVLGIDRAHGLGYAYGILTAACWGTSPIFIRNGLGGLPSPLWGITVALATATCIVVLWMRVRSARISHPISKLREMPALLRAAVGFELLAGVLAAIGAVARTAAIDLAPVAVAISLTQTTSLFALLFAPLLLGRHVERITSGLVLGAILVVASSVLVVISLNT